MPKKHTPKTFQSVPDLSPEKPVVETISENTTIRLRSLFPAKIKYSGHVSGQPYQWDEAGSVVTVRIEDAPYLLSKKLGSTGCCGSQSGGNQLFEQIG